MFDSPLSTAASRSMQRMRQILIMGSLLPLCWLGMMAVHELGHAAAAWATGGTVTKVVLHPLGISRTDVAPNPHPLAVAWAGPMFGMLLPLLLWQACKAAQLPGVHVLQFFAGFCLIANGAYLAGGSIQGIGDAGDLLRWGAPLWSLWVFGALTMPLGLFLWHGLGRHFGIGPHAVQIPNETVGHQR
ncbi:MAG: M50 family metallopeptidase [Planctomycetaceae bacterium]|nr:M50 family metallopeptidase [Planctomycetaceae bacterium]